MPTTLALWKPNNDFVRAPGGVLRKGYGAANDACVACHTHVAVDINFQKKYALKFNANAFNGGAIQNTTSPTIGNWDVGGFAPVGIVNIETFGNSSGNTFAASNQSYNRGPGTNLYLNGTKVTGMNGTASDSAAALTS